MAGLTIAIHHRASCSAARAGVHILGLAAILTEILIIRGGWRSAWTAPVAFWRRGVYNYSYKKPKHHPFAQAPVE